MRAHLVAPFRALAFSLLIGLCPTLARAQAALSVAPIRLQIEPGSRSTSFTASLGNGDAKLIQIHLMRWTREGGEDRYEPADGMIATPPLFKLSAGASQVVRVGFSVLPPKSDLETAWRVFVEEVPDEASPPLPGQVRMKLRLGLPLFVPPAKIRRVLAWSLVRKDGHLQLHAVNSGNVHRRFDRLELRDGAGQLTPTVLAGPLNVFPAESRDFPLDAGLEAAVLAQGHLRLVETGDDDRSEHDLPLPPP